MNDLDLNQENVRKSERMKEGRLKTNDRSRIYIVDCYG